jgi:hypothetical protein
MERYKKPEGLIQNLVFTLKHEGDASVVEKARNLFLVEQSFLKSDIRNGKVNVDDLNKISSNSVLQNKYQEIMRKARGFGRRTYISAENGILSLTPVEEAGWFDFQLRYYEKRWSLQLLSDEERVLPYRNL